MLEFRTGNMFDVEAQYRVNTVNCVGVMGKGVAKEFAERYPAMYEKYKFDCGVGLITPGSVWVFHEADCDIWCAATKDHWRHPSKYMWVQKCVDSLAILARDPWRNGGTVTIPALGCGNGGLEWAVVKGMIAESLSRTGMRVVVFEPETDPRPNWFQ